MHPRAKATSPTGTPGPGHSNGFLWAFKAGFLRLSKLPFASPQTLQNSPNPPNAPNPPKPAKPSKHRPQQAPQIHSNDFLDAFKAALTGGGARATAMTFYGPQSCSLPACKGSKLPKFQTPSPTCTLGPRPSPTGTPGPGSPTGFPNRHPRARATAMTFYELSKLPFASPQRLQTPPKFQTPRARATAMRLFMNFKAAVC